MVGWTSVTGKIAEFKTVPIDVKKILEEPWSESDPMVSFQVEGRDVELDALSFIKPLGDYGKVLLREENSQEALRQAMSLYWSYRGQPRVTADFMTMQDGNTSLLRLRKMVAEGDESHLQWNAMLQKVNPIFDYSKVVIGSAGEKLELQLLCPSSRIEVDKNDLLDPGLFLHFSNRVHIAAGVNRLVCNNGLTRRMSLWEGDGDNISEATLASAVELAQWLASQKGSKVNSVIELSAVLKLYGKLVERFWEKWSKMLESGELDWYTVIADLTEHAGKSLSGSRYALLTVHEEIASYLREHKCPSCSSVLV